MPSPLGMPEITFKLLVSIWLALAVIYRMSSTQQIDELYKGMNGVLDAYLIQAYLLG